MSAENVRLFLKKVSEDKELKKTLQDVPLDDMETALTSVIHIAGKAGYDFNKEDYMAVIYEMNNLKLSDEDLDKVSAGTFVKGNFHPSSPPVIPVADDFLKFTV